jgi:hypothetical protein
MTDQELAAIQELCDKATPVEKWKFRATRNWWILKLIRGEIRLSALSPDMAFIAQSRELIPRLLAEIKELRKK